MTHDFSVVFDTDNPLWQRVLEIFDKNEKYDKKVVKNRNLHHKFPRSFSKALGEEVDNDKDNLISLSLADHFLVHYYYYLLAKKGYRQSMALAFRMMARKGMKYITPETAEAMAKDYEDAVEISRQFVSAANKGKIFSDEYRQKLSESHKGHVVSDEHRQKVAESLKGKPKSAEHRKKLSEARKGKIPWNKGKHDIYSEETRKKMSESQSRRTQTDETRQKISNALKGKHWSIVNGKREWN